MTTSIRESPRLPQIQPAPETPREDATALGVEVDIQTSERILPAPKLIAESAIEFLRSGELVHALAVSSVGGGAAVAEPQHPPAGGAG